MASAILVDVTIGRMLRVPAAMALLGARNWYLPRWLHRILSHRTPRTGAPARPERTMPESATYTAAP